MSGSNLVMSLVTMGLMAVVGDYALFKAQGQMMGMAWGGNPSETYLEHLTARLSATRTPEEETALDAFLPAAPNGWTRAPYADADGEALTGGKLEYDPLGGTMGGDHTTVLLQSLADNPKNIAQKVETYRKGDQMVIVHIVHRPPGWSYDLATKVMETITLSDVFGDNSDLSVYASLHGVALRIDPPEDKNGNLLNYRHFVADLGKDAELEVVTNAPDADVRTILSQIDVVGLAALSGLPVADANASLPILWDAEAKAVEGLSSREQIEARYQMVDKLLQRAPEGAAAAAAEAPDAEEAETEAAGVLDIAKPAKGTCVRRAGELICP